MSIRDVLQDLNVTHIDGGSVDRGILIVSPRNGYLSALESHELLEKIFSAFSEIGLDIPILLLDNIDVTHVTKDRAVIIRDQLDRFINQ